jgi:hypothetical protein
LLQQQQQISCRICCRSESALLRAARRDGVQRLREQRQERWGNRCSAEQSQIHSIQVVIFSSQAANKKNVCAEMLLTLLRRVIQSLRAATQALDPRNNTKQQPARLVVLIALQAQKPWSTEVSVCQAAFRTSRSPALPA